MMTMLLMMRVDADYDDGDADVIYFFTTLEGAHAMKRCDACGCTRWLH